MPSNRCCKSCALPVVYLPLVTFSFTCSRWDILLILLLLLPVELPTRWRSIAIKCHNAADLNDVTSGVWFRQPAHHHVRISNCLHLTIRTLHFARTSRPEQKLRLVRSTWTDLNCQKYYSRTPTQLSSYTVSTVQAFRLERLGQGTNFRC